MNPPHPEPGLPRRHHHLVHLDPRHHHHVHIHLCCRRRHHHHHHNHGANLPAPAPPAHLHDHDNQQRHPALVLFSNTTYPSAAPWPPRTAVREGVEGLDPEPGPLHAEEADDDEGEPVYVLTDEWAEFFAKSEAKRRLAKQQKKKGRK